jgi:hypothetical protein
MDAAADKAARQHLNSAKPSRPSRVRDRLALFQIVDRRHALPIGDARFVLVAACAISPGMVLFLRLLTEAGDK